MEESLNPESVSTNDPENLCINCGSPEILAGHANKLCAPCRQSLIKFPIPLWVKLFGAGILVTLVISMIWLPANFKAAINLERAERAEERGDYLTEQKELERTLKVAPNSTEAQAHMLIAAYRNFDLETAINSGRAVYGKQVDDSVLLHKVNVVFDELTFYFPDSAMNATLGQYKDKKVTDTVYKVFLKKNPDNIYAMMALASLYRDERKYIQADSLLTKLLSIKNDFMGAIANMASVKRDIGQFDASLKYCDEMLKLNRQSTYAMSSKARTLLKSKRYTDGLKLAQQCYALDNDDPYNTCTLALAYHISKDYKKRDQFIALANKDSLHASYYKYVGDVINNKIQF